MTLSQVVVLLVGVVAIAGINLWLFPRHRRRTAERLDTGDAGGDSGGGEGRDVTVVVDGGYDPASIHARRGEPLRLVFDRREDASCSEELVLPAFGIRRFLAPFSKTVVELRPAEAGVFDFTCGMGMLRGHLIVEET